MPTFEQNKYCPNCKRNVSADKEDRCNICGGKIIRSTWSVRFRIQGLNGEIHKRLSGFETKVASKQAYLKFISEYTSPIINEKLTFPFNEIFNEYLNSCKLDNTESTVYDKEKIFNSYISPYFKNKDIVKITKADLVAWQNYLWQLKNKNKSTYSWKYLIKIRGYLYNFLTYCENIYDIQNKMRSIKSPKNTSIKKDISFWELHEFNDFILNCDDVLFNTLWSTFFFTGARFNEIRALSDSDISGNQITINKALSGKKCKDPSKPKPIKNYKIIKKAIPEILAEKINDYKTWKQENGISDKFLFGGNLPLSENTIRRKLIEDLDNANKVLDKKLKIITPHGFRHSYVSLLIHLGVSTKVIAELIGDREEQVIKTYGHLYAGAKEQAINLLNLKINEVRT